MVFERNPPNGAAEGRKPPVLLQIRLPVLGVPIEFETDAPIVHDALERAIGEWRRLYERPELLSPSVHAIPRIRLRLAHENSDRGDNIVVTSAGPGLVELNGAGVRGSADATSLTASCTMTASVLRDRYLFEETVLPSLVLGLTSYLDRQPLHAAAVRRNGQALLLHGRSGAGKSTLAYVAMRSGWDVLSDDAVFIQSTPQLRVWARPPLLHLPIDAVDYFPELHARPLVRRQNGKLKYCVESATPWAGALVPVEDAVLCLLERGSGPADAQRIDADVAVATVLRSLDAGFDLFRDTIGPVLRALIGTDAWIVRTAPDPRDTLALLDGLTGA